MNHMQIIKRSWEILRSYRALWVFGIILALTSYSWRGNGGGNGVSGNGNSRPFRITPPEGIDQQVKELTRFFKKIPSIEPETWIGMAIAVLIILLLLVVVSRMANYVSRTALIRMVDEYEHSGEKVTWKQGFRMGWTRAAWRLFLIDLSIYLPLVIGVILMFGCAALPILLGLAGSGEPSALGIIATIGLAFMIIFMIIIIAVLLAMIIRLIRRTCVLENVGVRAAIRQGWDSVRNNFVDVLLLWLILLGIQVGYLIALIPVILLLVGVGLLFGGGGGFLAYTTLHAMTTELAALITAVILGFSLFILVLAIPLTFLGGLRETYLSSAWTLAYRELKPKEGLELDSPPGIEGLEPA